jgi:hypothetical protein
MTFAQQNRITTRFSERIPVVKQRLSVKLCDILPFEDIIIITNRICRIGRPGGAKTYVKHKKFSDFREGTGRSTDVYEQWTIYRTQENMKD